MIRAAYEKYRFTISESVMSRDFEFLLCQNPDVREGHILFIISGGTITNRILLKLSPGIGLGIRQTSADLAYIVVGNTPAFALHLDTGVMEPVT